MFENIVLHAMWFVLAAISPLDMWTLTSSWNEANPNQTERAFCAIGHIAIYHNRQNAGDLTNGQAVVVISEGSVRPAPQDTVRADGGGPATPYSISSDCPNDDSTFTIHTHTPTTCEPTDAGGPETCHIGGDDAYQCLPSDQDLVVTAARKFKIGAVQCDKHALVYFAPVIKRPATKTGKKAKKHVNSRVTARQGSGIAWRRINNRHPSR